MLIETVMGDIAEVEADALVNAANSELWMGSGVAGAIKRRGGRTIESEAVSKGPIQVGDAVATRAGSLKASWVIHAAAMGPDLVTDGHRIREATQSAFRVAEELQLKSIALPSLGTGVGGFPIDEAAAIMTKVAMDHARRTVTLRRIIFVLFSDEAKKAFDMALGRISQAEA